MNCKEGDLAVIVGARRLPENIGIIVEVVCRAVDGARCESGIIDLSQTTGPCWVIRTTGRDLTSWNLSFGIAQPGMKEAICRDDHLIPIRDPGEDAADEMLRPLPEEVAA